MFQTIGKYDVAISTAFSGLDYIVVETTAAAQACVKMLHDNNLGIATFMIMLPLLIRSNSRTAILQVADKDKHDTTVAKREEEVHSSSAEEDISSESDFEGVVQADFAFFDPKPDDFHGVKVLLQTYLDNKEWDLSSFVELILQQTTVGTVIKIEDDEDNSVYGFVSALNVQRYKDCKCMMEVKEFLLKKCEDKEIKDKLKSYLGELAADVGFLISQRVVNLPPQHLPPMYDGLFDEIS